MQERRECRVLLSQYEQRGRHTVLAAVRTALETHILSRVAGQERREALRRELAEGNLDLPPELVACLLDEEDRNAIGRIHPAFMGGEYLPPLLDEEVEIARASRWKHYRCDRLRSRPERKACGAGPCCRAQGFSRWHPYRQQPNRCLAKSRALKPPQEV